MDEKHPFLEPRETREQVGAKLAHMLKQDKTTYDRPSIIYVRGVATFRAGSTSTPLPVRVDDPTVYMKARVVPYVEHF